MNQDLVSKLKKLCEADMSIGLLYLFGSQAKGGAGPLSDYDFAVYLDSVHTKNIADKKLELIPKIAQVISSDALDLVVLNENLSTELKYAVIHEGELLFEREPFRVLIEPRIMNEYFDFRAGLLRYGLTNKVYVE